jgi:ankyrin repeat protein
MQSVDFTYEDILIELSHADIREIYEGNLDVNQPDVLGDYLLNLACEHLQVENVEFFISKGADIEHTNHFSSDTPILLANPWCI